MGDVPTGAATEPPPAAMERAQFGVVRDRLFHAMLVRISLGYARHVKKSARRCVEFSLLVLALTLLALLVYVHVALGGNSSTCLQHLRDTWPRDGILRVEVISNLNRQLEHHNAMSPSSSSIESLNVTRFDLRRILIEGPSALPPVLKSWKKKEAEEWEYSFSRDDSLWRLFVNDKAPLISDRWKEEPVMTYEYVVEYSMEHGFLRLSSAARERLKIPLMLVQLDADDEKCFGDWLSKGLMHYVVGYEDVLMAAVKALAENETDKGYLRDIITGEHYRFVSMWMTKSTYLTALFVMLVFIFLFIVELLQMFEMNQALVFPAAPLLTVILALVGMEAIMSEVFNDTSTAFYVILLVWIADQYDAICCHSPISKRHWLRFFYVYQFAFYSYQYRFNGQYGGLALLTSTCFILHSMLFFFHHYEMPLIVYQERLQRIINDLQHNSTENGQGPSMRTNDQPTTLLTEPIVPVEEEQPGRAVRRAGEEVEEQQPGRAVQGAGEEEQPGRAVQGTGEEQQPGRALQRAGEEQQPGRAVQRAGEEAEEGEQPGQALQRAGEETAEIVVNSAFEGILHHHGSSGAS